MQAPPRRSPVITVGADGKTAPVFSYADAKRERVCIPVAGVDQDANGVIDRVAIDIIRPKESGPTLKVPAIIDDSPYYTSVGRGNETQFIHTTPTACWTSSRSSTTTTSSRAATP